MLTWVTFTLINVDVASFSGPAWLALACVPIDLVLACSVYAWVRFTFVYVDFAVGSCPAREALTFIPVLAVHTVTINTGG
jgi:hypothetical protein